MTDQKNTNALFIAFEGIDGSGKSTQVRLLKERLEQLGHKVITTFEPTDDAIGRMIRDIFKNKHSTDHRIIAGLFVADRLHHLLNEENGMMKALSEGNIVITDRYYLSSYAYHGVHMDMDWVIDANAMAARIRRPDITIYVDLPVEISLQRLSSGRAFTEMYETEDNLKAVSSTYRQAIEKVSAVENICIVNGHQDQATLATDIWNAVAPML
jgi:dTMP kinase